MSYIVNTPCGKVKGVKSNVDGVVAFKGIRYATANRFEYAKEVTSWEGIYYASEYGNCCYQPRSFYNEEENLKKIFYYNEFRKGATYTYSEDCLFLNIWVPEGIKETDSLPVLFYIHGGGYTGGCGHELQFDGPLWPKHGVIGVTINYRLGPLGFTCLQELKDEAGHSGNYGLYDQVTALNWIKHNISSFGGDSNNITIMGQSAGAMSVQHLCLSPITKGMFHKAIMSSGGGINKILATVKEEKEYDFCKKIMDYAGCSTLEELRNLPVDKLFEAWNTAKKEKFGMPSAPVIDGVLIVDSPSAVLKRNEQHHIPYIIGSNSEDMFPPFMFSISKKWCRKQSSPSYCYMFNHQLPSDNNGAWHSADLWYFFGTLDNCWREMNEMDFTLSNTMIKYITNFAKTGNPNGSDVPTWNTSTKKENKVMHLGNGIVEMKKAKMSTLIINMLTKKQVGE